MSFPPTTVIPIQDQTHVGEARRAAVRMAEDIGLDEIRVGELAIITTEAANNVFLHGKGGQLLLQRCERDGRRGVEVIALDTGPGMDDVDRCLGDGYSTRGTSGTGLGAIRRLAAQFAIYTRFEKGTVVLARVLADPPHPPTPSETLVGRVNVALLGEDICGDTCDSFADGNRHLFTVVDGLGHGLLAAHASLVAAKAFRAHHLRTPEEIILAAHDDLRQSRGAAMAVVAIDLQEGMAHFAGIGNIAVSVVGPDRSRGLPSLSGIVGHEVRRVQRFDTEWGPESLLVMHSDGLGSQWRLEKYPGLSMLDPTLVAAVLFRDFVRGRDDVTVLVARQQTGGSA